MTNQNQNSPSLDNDADESVMEEGNNVSYQFSNFGIKKRLILDVYEQRTKREPHRGEQM